MRVAFVSEGKLFLKEDGGDAVELESPFARETSDRLAEHNQKRSWRNQGGGGGTPYDSRMVWGRQAEAAPDGIPLFQDIARGRKSGEVVYTLIMSASSGLFRQDVETRDEVRLFHRQEFRPCGVTCNPATGDIFVASRDRENAGKLEHVEEESRRREQITVGDGHDSNPAFDPARPDTVVFQSAGIARDEEGNFAGIGPSAICELSLKGGDIEVLLEDNRYDFVSPRFSRGGTLYYIRRPYESAPRAGLGSQLKALFLLPYHLLLAVFGFLEAFTRMFAKESLRPSPVGPKFRQPPRKRFATFQGVVVDMEKALKNGPDSSDSVQIIPGTWTLVRQEPDGSTQDIANHVVAFDLHPDGSVIYSDGLRIWSLGAERKKLHSGQIIQSVAVLD